MGNRGKTVSPGALHFPGLIHAMLVRGDTQTRLMQVLGVNRTAICHRFSGKTPWKLPEIEKLMKRYGKTYEELFLNGRNLELNYNLKDLSPKDEYYD